MSVAALVNRNETVAVIDQSVSITPTVSFPLTSVATLTGSITITVEC